MGEQLTRWTIRIALLLCAASVVASYLTRHTSASEPRRLLLARQARLLWTLAFACYLLHLAAAFQFYHAWSHTAAWKHTANRTQEVIGIHWGGGLWFNYLFTIAWGIDVAWSWAQPTAYEKASLWLRWAWATWFLLIVFFATIVFETGWTRWISATVLAILAMWTILLGLSARSATEQESHT